MIRYRSAKEVSVQELRDEVLQRATTFTLPSAPFWWADVHAPGGTVWLQEGSIHVTRERVMFAALTSGVFKDPYLLLRPSDYQAITVRFKHPETLEEGPIFTVLGTAE